MGRKTTASIFKAKKWGACSLEDLDIAKKRKH